MVKLVVAATLALSLKYCACQVDNAPADTPQVVASESRDLIARATVIYQQSKIQGARPPRPFRIIRIERNRATLSIAGPTNSLDLRYAAEWQQVYAAHHNGQIICVHMNLVWASGNFDQDYPLHPSSP